MTFDGYIGASIILSILGVIAIGYVLYIMIDEMRNL